MGAREAALKALLAFEKRDAWSDAFLNGLFRQETMPPREAALCYRLTAGVLQNREAIDWYLRPYLHTSLQPAVRAILRCAVYQLAYMDRIPVSAAVNEAVDLAKRKANPAAARLVNAVLRRLTAQPLPPLPAGDDAESLSIRYSHPTWLTDYYLRLLGPERTRRLLEADNRVPPTTLRVNRLKGDQAAALAALEKEGAEAVPIPPLDGFLGLESRGGVSGLAAFQAGLVTVQDPAAALPVLASGAEPGLRVLDACAAPGGKSFLLAQQMENRGELVACDLHPAKLERIREGAARLGVVNLATRQMDARTPPPDFRAAFDLVLADAPCSGLGVVRKKPEIRYKAPEALAALPDIQLAILNGLADCVRPGGVLVYSTCTLLREENEAVTDAFLAAHPGFSREALPLPHPFGIVASGQLTVWPDEYETDGFYLCRMRKRT